MNVIFASEDRKDVLKLPIVPPELQWSIPYQSIAMDTLNGEIVMMGKRKLITLSIDSFFPNRAYKFAKSKVRGHEAINFFTRHRNAKRPVRCIITSRNGRAVLNALFAIENFTFGYDKAGDTTYKLDLKEFVRVKV